MHVEVVRPKGFGSVNVEYDGLKCSLPVTVVDHDTPTLMCHDWLKSLHFNWEELLGESKAVNKTEMEDQRVVDLEVFTEKLGCLKESRCIYQWMIMLHQTFEGPGLSLCEMEKIWIQSFFSKRFKCIYRLQYFKLKNSVFCLF